MSFLIFIIVFLWNFYISLRYFFKISHFLCNCSRSIENVNIRRFKKFESLSTQINGISFLALIFIAFDDDKPHSYVKYYY